jgi:hypothetical protein
VTFPLHRDPPCHLNFHVRLKEVGTKGVYMKSAVHRPECSCYACFWSKQDNGGHTEIGAVFLKILALLSQGGTLILLP